MAVDGQTGQWKNKLFGCFDNCNVCIWSTFLPCIVEGRIAEKVGENCFWQGCYMFIPVANLICRSKIRGKVREQKGIPGTSCNDCIMSWICGACALCQEAKEVGALEPQTAVAPAQAMARD